MAGGIFPGKPFELNIKCVIITLLLASGYWYLPSKNLYVLIVLLWLPYILIAWYDYLYDCKTKMQPTLFPFGRYLFLPFKPPYYKQAFDKLDKEKIQTMDYLDHNVLWTLIIVVVAYYILKNKK